MLMVSGMLTSFCEIATCLCQFGSFGGFIFIFADCKLPLN